MSLIKAHSAIKPTGKSWLTYIHCVQVHLFEIQRVFRNYQSQMVNNLQRSLWEYE